MHRIDTSTAQVDKFGTGKNGFTGGNPQTGELPTALDEKFFDSIQEEIAGVIEGAGMALDKTTNAQLLAALKVLFPLGAAGKLGVATNAQMATGTSTTLLPTVAAVMSLFSKRSFASKDYIRIPDVSGGLILQWGTISITSGAQTAVGFPITFPSACLNVMAINGGSASPVAFPAVTVVNGTYFNLYAAKSAGTAAESGTSWYWFAIGY